METILGLDKECKSLVKTLNSLNGIATIESCCGHLASPYRIFFLSDNFSTLGLLYRCVDKRYSDGKWRIELNCSDTTPTNGFLLTSVDAFKSTSEMEKSVDSLITNIEYWSGEEFKDYFNAMDSIVVYKMK